MLVSVCCVISQSEVALFTCSHAGYMYSTSLVGEVLFFVVKKESND